MARFNQVKKLSFKKDDLYNLVLDVEKYPEFLPWCSNSRIISNGEGYFIADLVIEYKIFREKYTSRVDFFESEHENNIHVVQTSGPFSFLDTKWKFIDISEKEKIETILEFEIEFQFKSKIIDSLVGNFFGKVSSKMIDAFELRAEKLFS